MNGTYLLACWEESERRVRLQSAAKRAAAEVMADPEFAEWLATASPYASVRVHQNNVRRLAGLPEFAE